MMSSIGSGFTFTILWAIHIASVVAFFTGVLFCIIAAVKTFAPRQLASWGVGLIAIGAIACLFTIAVIGRPWIGIDARGSGSMMNVDRSSMRELRDRMMRFEPGRNDREFQDMRGMMETMMGDEEL